MNNRSFTLIELLVVIAIVGILSGIVLMSSSGAVNSAQDTRIKNDIDSIRKAILSYKALYGVAPIEDPVYSVDGTDFTLTAILSDGQILNYAFDEGFSYNVSFSNPIINGSFDGTWTGWSTSGGASIKSVNDTTAYLGSYASYLNYELTCADERIYQNITIPNAYGIINLDFWEKTYLNYWGGPVGIKINDDYIWYTGGWESGRNWQETAWANHVIDVSDYKGQSVQLSIAWGDFYNCSAGDHDGWIRVDEIKLTQP